MTTIQKGFGWTNGVILDLLEKYGHQMKAAAFAECPLALVCLFLFWLL